jgi:hypothetical protein
MGTVGGDRPPRRSARRAGDRHIRPAREGRGGRWASTVWMETSPSKGGVRSSLLHTLGAPGGIARGGWGVIV